MIQQNEAISIKPLGDSALVVQLDSVVNEETHEKVMCFMQAVNRKPFKGFLEAVPTYTNVTIFYDPFEVHQAYECDATVFETVSSLVKGYTMQIGHNNKGKARLIEIPVLYGGEYGPDLAHVAAINNLTEEEVIELHTGSEYLVYMLGFAPGFPFLGGMDERIVAPRKRTPRAKIPAGSVGIAGKQTGIYPFDSPGGWQIIGRTPVDLFLPHQSPPTLIQPGDRLRYVPMSYEEYVDQKRGIAQWQSA